MPVTAPVAIQTGVTVLLQEDAIAPSSVPVVSTVEPASTPPGAHAVEEDGPAAVEGDGPAAEQGNEVAEDPTAAAVQEQVRLPHLHVLRELGTSSTCCQTARMSFCPPPSPLPTQAGCSKVSLLGNHTLQAGAVAFEQPSGCPWLGLQPAFPSARQQGGAPASLQLGAAALR